MKKLIVMAVAVVMAVCSQASAVKWTSDVVYAPKADGSFNTDLKLYSATDYAFSCIVTFYDTDGNKIKSLTSGTSTDVVNKSSKATASTLADDYNFIYQQEYGYSAEYKLTYGGKTYTMTVGSDDSPLAWTANKSNGSHTPTIATADKWTVQSIPEPTSGLLLLLGVAGLALRRRRA